MNKVWEWETKDSSCKELKTQRQQISKQPMRNLWATNHLPCTCVSQSIHGPNQVQLVEPSRAPHSHSCSDGNGSFQRHTHAQHARTRICIVLSGERGETKEVRPPFLASSSKKEVDEFSRARRGADSLWAGGKKQKQEIWTKSKTDQIAHLFLCWEMGGRGTRR